MNHLPRSGPGAVACGLCEAGYFDARAAPDALADADCLRCGGGLTCDEAGATVATVHVDRGHWRASAASDVVENCRRSRCAGGEGAGDALCEDGSVGPLCDVCDRGYTYRAASDACVSCAGNRVPNGLLVAASGLAAFAAFLLVVIRRDDAAKADAVARNRLRLAFKLRSKWRILFVALQILTMFPAILNDVSYPPAYARFVAPFQIVGLDVPALLPLSCLTAGTFDYFASLRLMTLGPLVVVAAYGVLFHAFQRAPSLDDAFLFFFPKRRRSERRRISLMPIYSFTLFASFCIFPPTSLTILKCFKCDAVFDGAGKGCEIPNFKGSYLGRFPLVSADSSTSDHLSERSRT